MKDLKPVKAILKRTPNFPRSSEGSQPLKLRVVFKRNQPFENQVITHVATREAREEVYRQVGIETSRQSDVAEAMEQSTETPLSVDTTTGEDLKREQMELGSPITKVRKVTAPNQVTPGMSEEPSQTGKEECIDLTNIGDTSDKEMLDDTGTGQMVKVKQEIIDEGDEYFTGLINCDSDDDDFPSRLIIHESDDSKDDDDECDADQIEMQCIYEQQERNRNRKQVSAVDSRIKTEPDDTEDTGEQGTHHTSLEMIYSLTPLSSEDMEEYSTIPSSEDLLEVGVSQQSKEGEEL